MASLVEVFIEKYNSLFWDRRDPRVDGWLLMSSPFPTLAICLSYVYLVKVAGPRFMKDRPPFKFRKLLVAYNAFQVLFSAWIFFELGMSGWFGKYSYRCQPVDYSDHPTAKRFGMGGWFRGYSFRCQPVDYSHGDVAVRMVHASWWYYFSKFTEFLDTIFFVLRKKFEHVSTLHVIHHGCMPMSVWFGVKFTPGGHSTFFGLLNSFVHIIMYLYYMLAAMGPQYHRFLWWKKYLTTLQMIQFVGIFTHAFQLCFIDCNYPRAFMWWIGGHAVLFFFLFSEFYRSAYSSRRRSDSKPVKSFTSIFPCMLMEPNGCTNGHANGHANGTLKNGLVRNGVSTEALKNGFVKGVSNGGHAIGNGIANGHTPLISNGHTPTNSSEEDRDNVIVTRARKRLSERTE